jgi:predicted transcriptional regulator
MSDKDTAKRLLRLKEKIEGAKDSLAKAEGRKEELMRRLKDDHDVETEAEARKLLKKLEKDTEKMEEELEERVSELEEALARMEG